MSARHTLGAALAMAGMLFAAIPVAKADPLTPGPDQPRLIAINGERLSPDAEGFDRYYFEPSWGDFMITWVPLRPIIEKLGSQVRWDEERLAATAVVNSRRIEVQVGQTAAHVNGYRLQLFPYAPFKAPFVRDGRLFVPLRLVVHALGLDLRYEQAPPPTRARWHSHGPSNHVPGSLLSRQSV